MQRRTVVLDKLEHGKRDVWFATGDMSGRPHLVPFSLGWDGQHLLVATEARSRTLENIRSSGLARLAMGDTRDVILIDARVTESPINELDLTVADSFTRRNGWDPRHSSTQNGVAHLHPRPHPDLGLRGRNRGAHHYEKRALASLTPAEVAEAGVTSKLLPPQPRYCSFAQCSNW
jgi:hypothetical protein